MSLTPLHFIRHTDTPSYGLGIYATDCGRFDIFRFGKQQWTVLSRSSQWNRWLDNHGLIDAMFSTRAAVVDILSELLNADEVLQ